jgi:hypothetical protein
LWVDGWVWGCACRVFGLIGTSVGAPRAHPVALVELSAEQLATAHDSAANSTHVLGAALPEEAHQAGAAASGSVEAEDADGGVPLSSDEQALTVAHAYSGGAHGKAMAAYKQLRGGCQWQVDSMADYNQQYILKGSSMCYTAAGDGDAQRHKSEEEKAYGWSDENTWDLIVNPACPGNLSQVTVSRCEVNGTHEGDGKKGGAFTWLVYRFGPFQGNGVFDWHQLAMRDLGGLAKRMVNGSVWSTGACCAATPPKHTVSPTAGRLTACLRHESSGVVRADSRARARGGVRGGG